MKVCENCGDEISTRDGDNTCRTCEDNSAVKKKKRAAARKAKDDIMRSCGLTKVRGALGGTYWE